MGHRCMYRMGGEVGKMGLEMVVSNCVMEFLCDPPPSPLLIQSLPGAPIIKLVSEVKAPNFF
jgi:hypothetical protein